MHGGLRPLRAVLVTLRIVARPPVQTKLKLTAPEMTACVLLLSRGKTLPQALASIEAQRAFIAQFNLSLSPR